MKDCVFDDYYVLKQWPLKSIFSISFICICFMCVHRRLLFGNLLAIEDSDVSD